MNTLEDGTFAPVMPARCKKGEKKLFFFTPKQKKYEKLSQNFKVVSHIFVAILEMDKTLEQRDSGFET